MGTSEPVTATRGGERDGAATFTLSAPVQGCIGIVVRDGEGATEILGAAAEGEELRRLIVLAPGCPGDPEAALRLWAGIETAPAPARKARR